MGKTKKEPKVKAPKPVKLNRDGTPKAPRKPREKTSKVEALLKSLRSLVKSEASIAAKVASNTTKAAKARAKLKAWGTADADEISLEQLLDTVVGLHTANFVPPAGSRVVVEPFGEGDLVQLKSDYVEKYSLVYSAVERESMSYSMYDDVNRVAMCPTSERTMVVKLKHIEPRGTVVAPVADAPA